MYLIDSYTFRVTERSVLAWSGTMRFSDGVLDVVAIFLTLALYVSCTGTRFN